MSDQESRQREPLLDPGILWIETGIGSGVISTASVVEASAVVLASWNNTRMNMYVLSLSVHCVLESQTQIHPFIEQRNWRIHGTNMEISKIEFGSPRS